MHHAAEGASNKPANGESLLKARRDTIFEGSRRSSQALKARGGIARAIVQFSASPIPIGNPVSASPARISQSCKAAPMRAQSPFLYKDWRGLGFPVGPASDRDRGLCESREGHFTEPVKILERFGL